jgi:hypothetical protein
MVRVVNLSKRPQTLDNNELLGHAVSVAGLISSDEKDAQAKIKSPTPVDFFEPADAAQEDTISAYHHIQCLLEKIPDHLSATEKQKAEDLIKRYANLFAMNLILVAIPGYRIALTQERTDLFISLSGNKHILSWK